MEPQTQQMQPPVQTSPKEVKKKKTGLFLLLALGVIGLCVVLLLGGLALAAILLPWNSGITKSIAKVPALNKVLISDEKRGRMAIESFWEKIGKEETESLAGEAAIEGNLTLNLEAKKIPDFGDFSARISSDFSSKEKKSHMKVKLNGEMGGVGLSNDVILDVVSTEDNVEYVKINEIPNVLTQTLGEECVSEVEDQWFRISSSKEPQTVNFVDNKLFSSFSCFSDKEKVKDIQKEVEKVFGPGEGKFDRIQEINGDAVYVFSYAIDIEKLNSLLNGVGSLCGWNEFKFKKEDFPIEFEKVNFGVDGSGAFRLLEIAVKIAHPEEGSETTASMTLTINKIGEGISDIEVPEEFRDFEEIEDLCTPILYNNPR
jgi:hypothetical protein